MISLSTELRCFVYFVLICFPKKKLYLFIFSILFKLFVASFISVDCGVLGGYAISEPAHCNRHQRARGKFFVSMSPLNVQSYLASRIFAATAWGMVTNKEHVTSLKYFIIFSFHHNYIWWTKSLPAYCKACVNRYVDFNVFICVYANFKCTDMFSTKCQSQ